MTDTPATAASATSTTSTTATLAATGLSVRFGGVHALDGVDLEVRPGQLVGLIGPNGAGKTTFVDAITGFVPSTGHVELDGRDLTALPPHARAAAGLSRTWQTIEIVADLTVGENLAVATRSPGLVQTDRDLLRTGARTDPKVEESLELVELGWAADLMPSDLTQSQHTLVGVARSIAMGPRVLCLDEPAAGLDAAESAELGRTLRRLVDGGTPMLLIDHDVGLVLSICDFIYVLEFGQLIAAGTPEAIRTDSTVVQAYLGQAAADLQP
jgi:branched-chain amino acid transport system ATP-binding protein